MTDGPKKPDTPDGGYTVVRRRQPVVEPTPVVEADATAAAAQPSAATVDAPPSSSAAVDTASAEADAVDDGWDDMISEPPAPASAPAPAEPVAPPRKLSDPIGPAVSLQRPQGSPESERRTYDVRAPRNTRSTQDSRHFRTAADLGMPQRPARNRPYDEPRRPGPRNAASPGARGQLPGRDRDARDRRPRDADPRGPDAGRRVSAPDAPDPHRTTSSPAPTPARAPLPPPAPAPTLADELRVLTARPVAEIRKAPAKDKPRTAKDALRARAEEARRRKSKGKGAGDRRSAQSEVESTDGDEAESAVSAERSDSDRSAAPRSKKGRSRSKEAKPREADAEVDAEPVKPKGLWQRIKGLFTGA